MEVLWEITAWNAGTFSFEKQRSVTLFHPSITVSATCHSMSPIRQTTVDLQQSSHMQLCGHSLCRVLWVSHTSPSLFNRLSINLDGKQMLSLENMASQMSKVLYCLIFMEMNSLHDACYCYTENFDLLRALF